MNNLLPKCVNIKLHDQAANEEKFTIEFKRNLIRRQIKNHEKELNIIQSKFDDSSVQLMEISSSAEYQEIMKTLSDIRFIKKDCLRKIITKKLNNLYKGVFCIK